MEVVEAAPLHLVTDYGDAAWVVSRVLVEACYREQQVLVRVEGVIFCGCANEGFLRR